MTASVLEIGEISVEVGVRVGFVRRADDELAELAVEMGKALYVCLRRLRPFSSGSSVVGGATVQSEAVSAGLEGGGR